MNPTPRHAVLLGRLLLAAASGACSSSGGTTLGSTAPAGTGTGGSAGGQSNSQTGAGGGSSTGGEANSGGSGTTQGAGGSSIGGANSIGGSSGGVGISGGSSGGGGISGAGNAGTGGSGLNACAGKACALDDTCSANLMGNGPGGGGGITAEWCTCQAGVYVCKTPFPFQASVTACYYGSDAAMGCLPPTDVGGLTDRLSATHVSGCPHLLLMPAPGMKMVSGPTMAVSSDGTPACCYDVPLQGCTGRPLYVAGRILISRVVTSRAWGLQMAPDASRYGGLPRRLLNFA